MRWQLDARDQIEQAHFDSMRTLPTTPATLANGARSFDRPPRDAGFGFDAAGNLASQRGEPLRYQADTVTEFGPCRYDWDACGRLQRRTEHRAGFRPRSWHFEWDAFDRLKTVHTPEGQRWRYVYDAFGRRRSKRCESPAAPHNPLRPERRKLRQAEYLWDGPTLAVQWKRYADGSSEQPAAVGPAGIAVATATADGPSGPPAAITAGHLDEDIQEWHFEPGSFKPLAIVQRQGERTPKLLHLVADLNGAPREALDNEGELLWAAQLDTWGQLARCHVKDQDRAYAARFGVGHRPAANDPAAEIDLRFANQWEDEESGLSYNLNRYYDPQTAQYASQDPLGPAGGARTHGYVHNPVTWSDPLGLAGCPGGGAAEGLAGVPGRVGSRIKLSNEGMDHVIARHLSGKANPSQFSLAEAELRSVLSSRAAASSPVVRRVESADGIRYIREFDAGRVIGTDRFNGNQATSVITIMTDRFGNLVSTFPGLLK